MGTLCAIHPIPQPEAIASELPLLELMAKLLSSLLNADREVTSRSRLLLKAEDKASKDALTGLYNRWGWDERLAEEEQRCRRQGEAACIIVIDLDGLKQINDRWGHGAGDGVIHQAGQALQEVVRQRDTVARVGGDEFTVLCTQCSLSAGRDLLVRISRSLSARQIDASLGVAARSASRSLLQTWEMADQAMYCCKRRKKMRRRFFQVLA